MRRFATLARSLPSSSARAGPSLRRHASSAPSSVGRQFLSGTLLLGGGAVFLAYYYDSRSLLHEKVVMPLMRLVDPETGHKLAVKVLSGPEWVRPADKGVDGPELQAEVFGLPVRNPVGMAAGFDKDAEAIDGLFDLGFGYVEIGSVCPIPQPGNPLPRFFRLTEDEACINRYGFNSLGHAQALAQLRARVHSYAVSHPSAFPSPIPRNPLPPAHLPRSLRPGQVLAVNLGKNKTSAADSNEDYVRGVRTLGPYADVVVINVSSPNTPGLRALQGREILRKLLSEVVGERDKIKSSSGLPKIAVKVACDLSEDELGDVAAAVRQSGVDGLIVSNTTIRRGELNLQSDRQTEVGGLSGRPLFPYALNALRTLRPLLPPSIPIIGCGGISTGSDALKMAEAGASLVQIYTAFGFRGVGAPRLLKDEISAALAGTSWKSRVGTEWAGGQMGWDENRLQKESDALKREAHGLGELLRHMNDKEDIQRLMREAQEALAPKKKSESRSKAPRDNAMGAEPGASAESTPKQSLMSTDIPSAASTVGTLAGEAGEADAPQQPASLVKDALQQPAKGQSTPSIVSAQTITQEKKVQDEDQWRKTVKEGSRRLV